MQLTIIYSLVRRVLRSCRSSSAAVISAAVSTTTFLPSISAFFVYTAYALPFSLVYILAVTPSLLSYSELLWCTLIFPEKASSRVLPFISPKSDLATLFAYSIFPLSGSDMMIASEREFKMSSGLNIISTLC